MCASAYQRGAAMLFKKDETIAKIGSGLRQQCENTTQEPLPRRWVDLIRHLDQHERKQSQAEPRQQQHRNG